jgi:hypothetical protein
MKTISIVFVAALSLAAFGCKKGADCGKAMSNSMELAKADMAKMPGAEGMMGKLKDLGVQRCTEDKWSDETVQCMIDAKTEADGKTCYSKLTPEQQGKMNKAAMEIMMPHGAGHAAAAAGSGEAPGSASGSGGSGSAPAADTGGGSAGSAAAPK